MSCWMSGVLAFHSGKDCRRAGSDEASIGADGDEAEPLLDHGPCIVRCTVVDASHQSPFPSPGENQVDGFDKFRFPAVEPRLIPQRRGEIRRDRKSTRLNSSHVAISYAVFCLKNKHRY